MPKVKTVRTRKIDMSKINLSTVESGRLGGMKTLKTKGRKHFVKAINIRWAKYRAAKKENENKHKDSRVL